MPTTTIQESSHAAKELDDDGVCAPSDVLVHDPGSVRRKNAKGKNCCVSIAKKLEVVRFYESLPSSVRRREEVVMRRFPESLSASGQLGRWRSAATKSHWKHLPLDVAMKSKELPNWARRSLDIKTCKARDPGWFFPVELQIAYDQVLVSRVHGMTSGADARELLRSKNILIGLQSERERYNKRVDKTNEKIQEHNSELWSRWEKGEISIEEAEESHRMLLKKAHSPIYI